MSPPTVWQVILLSLAAICPTAGQAQRVEPLSNAPERVSDEVRERSALFHRLLFEQCAPEELPGVMTEDYEHYSWQDGILARSRQEYARIYREACRERESPVWSQGSELLPDTVFVHSIRPDRAVLEGDLLFFSRHGATRVETYPERSRYLEIWERGSDDIWRISRAFTFCSPDNERPTWGERLTCPRPPTVRKGDGPPQR